MIKKDDITSTEKLLELIRSKGEDSTPSDQRKPAKRKLFKRKDESPAKKRSKKVVTIGIDISESDITLAVVKRVSEKKQKLLDILRIPLEAEIKKDSAEFVKLLKKSVKQLAGKYKAPSLWATISSADVETKFLQIPKVPPKQVPNAVRWAYQKETSIGSSQVFDFQVIDDTFADGEQKTNVIAYTAPRGEINATQDLFNKAGRPLKGISIVPFAIQNLLRAGWIESAGKNVCMLFIGRDWSRIAIFSRNVLILSRDIKAGVRSMVQAILETLDSRSELTAEPLTMVAPEEEIPSKPLAASPNLVKAEKLFAEFLDAGPAAEEALPDQKREKLIFGMVKPALDRVIRQVEMTLEHFSLKFDSHPIDNVYISGELSSKKNIARYIGKELGLQVEPMDPFSSLPEASAPESAGELAQAGDIYVPAAGMALSENKNTPNFIFTYVHKSRKAFAKRFNQVANAVFIGLLCVAMGVFYYQSEKVNAIKEKTKPLKTELAAYSPRLDRNLMASVTGKTVMKMKTYNAAANYYLPAAVIAELIAITPDNVKLTSVQAILGSVVSQQIEKSGKVLNIEGRIYGNSRFFEKNVTAYLVSLKKSSFFKQPKVKEKKILETGEGEVLRFVLSMSII
ncbi:MAG: pilus assembly protein PilM [Desulfobacterales bacterium]|nr:pilus assembly protein PilM [Desulfobacterales bacterium]